MPKHNWKKTIKVCLLPCVFDIVCHSVRFDGKFSALLCSTEGECFMADGGDRWWILRKANVKISSNMFVLFLKNKIPREMSETWFKAITRERESCSKDGGRILVVLSATQSSFKSTDFFILFDWCIFSLLLMLKVFVSRKMPQSQSWMWPLSGAKFKSFKILQQHKMYRFFFVSGVD